MRSNKVVIQLNGRETPKILAVPDYKLWVMESYMLHIVCFPFAAVRTMIEMNGEGLAVKFERIVASNHPEH